jgi:cyclase
MDLLPAIDLRGGRVVRLLRGDDRRRTAYSECPVEVLSDFAAAGARWVHVVDLDAAFGEPPQRAPVEELAAAARGLGVRVELGGGLGDEAAVAWALTAGCERAVVGSMAAREPERFGALARTHPGRLVPAVDVGGEAVRVAGWRERAGRPLVEVCGALRGLPCPAVLVTDVERDGALDGPNLPLARRVAEATGLPALLSGGVTGLDDLLRAAETPGIGGAVVGRALYEGRFTVQEALAACESARACRDARPLVSGLTVRVIPCLDVSGGRVVKGVRFQDLRDLGDPAEAARRYAEQGADEIVFLDIDAAPEARATALDWVRRAAERVFVPLAVGGGVRAVDDARALLSAGADKVGVNTAAAERPELLAELARRFGSQCVVLSIDARRSGAAGHGTGSAPAWEVVTHGGRRGTGRDALRWAVEGVERGAGEILLTSIDADGTRGGYDLDLVRRVSAAVPVPVIASGGAGGPAHLAQALEAGAAAVLAASIFHQGTWTVAAVKEELARRGFPVRPGGDEVTA